MSTIIDALITDRTQQDVDRLKELDAIGWENMTYFEQQEWMHGPYQDIFLLDGERLEGIDGPWYLLGGESNKGAYTAVDLNRVGKAMLYLTDMLNSYGYSVNVTPKTDWVKENKPSPTQMAHYLDDIRTIRRVLTLSTSVPKIPNTMRNLTPEAANDIERILQLIHQSLLNIADSWFYSGEIYAGEI